MKLVMMLLRDKLKDVEKEILNDNNYLKDGMLGLQSLGAKWARARIRKNEKFREQLNETIKILHAQNESRAINENEDEKEYYEKTIENYYCNRCMALNEFDCCCDDSE